MTSQADTMADQSTDPEHETRQRRASIYLKMPEEKIETFREIFELIDVDSGGFIDAEELYEGLKRVDSNVTREEVEETLKVADRDKSGDISFDEFLYVMDQIHGEAEECHETSGDKRKGTLVLARLNPEILKAPVYHVPHVIKHYTAGARLIGLSSRQLHQKMRMLTSNIADKYKNSPYTKPPAMPKDYPPLVNKKRPEKGVTPVPAAIQPENTTNKVPSTSDHGEFTYGTRRASLGKALVTAVDELDMIHEKEELSPSTRRDSLKQQIVLPDVNLDIDLNNLKINEDDITEIPTGSEIPKPLVESAIAPQPASPSYPQLKKRLSISEKKRIRRWRPPVVAKVKVKPPVLRVKYQGSCPTVDDLPAIRKEVKVFLNEYYDRVRAAAVEAAAKHWAKLCREGMSHVQKQDVLKNVFSTFSPFDKGKVVVASQWIPGISSPKVSNPRTAPFSTIV